MASETVIGASWSDSVFVQVLSNSCRYWWSGSDRLMHSVIFRTRLLIDFASRMLLVSNPSRTLLIASKSYSNSFIRLRTLSCDGLGGFGASSSSREKLGLLEAFDLTAGRSNLIRSGTRSFSACVVLSQRKALRFGTTLVLLARLICFRNYVVSKTN